MFWAHVVPPWETLTFSPTFTISIWINRLFAIQNQRQHVPCSDVRHHPGDAGYDDLWPPAYYGCRKHHEGGSGYLSAVRHTHNTMVEYLTDHHINCEQQVFYDTADSVLQEILLYFDQQLEMSHQNRIIQRSPWFTDLKNVSSPWCCCENNSQQIDLISRVW